MDSIKDIPLLFGQTGRTSWKVDIFLNIQVAVRSILLQLNPGLAETFEAIWLKNREIFTIAWSLDLISYPDFTLSCT